MRFLGMITFITALILPVFAQAEIIHDKVYESVMQTKTLRCGYADYAPWIMTDPNTKQVTGIMREVMDEIGKRMGVKVEWTASMGWGEITTAANSGKIDLFCNTVWTDKAQLRNMSLSRPLYYTPTYAYVRVDDVRFDHDYMAINDPKITIAGIDGDSSYIVMQDSFPKATMLALPNTATPSEQILSVLTKKADVFLADPSIFQEYNKSNPGKIRQVKGAPLFVMNEVLVTRAGEQQLMNVINTVLYSLINEGVIARIIHKYGVTTSLAPRPDVDLPLLTGK